MKVIPIRYSADVAASVKFYRTLGLRMGPSSRPGIWVEMPGESGLLAIHEADSDDAGSCELAFETEEPLDDVCDRMKAAGFETGPVIDENFGQSLRICDPDGTWVQVNSYDRELYT
jgi:catechol 2,3-dioxygenase-like lactoylglutathione lyase family enzyme